MYEGPSLTATDLLKALADQRVLPEEDIVSVLGEARHNIKLPKLESILIQRNILSDESLGLLKGALAGLPILPAATSKVTAELDVTVSRQSGALIVAAQRLTVAFIEDTPVNVDRVARTIGTTDFDVWLCTSQQFANLHRAAYLNEVVDVRKPLGTLADVLDEAIRRRASDAHLSVGQPPKLRIDGRLVSMQVKPADRAWMDSEMLHLAGNHHMQVARETSAADFAYQYGVNRFRCNLGLDTEGLTLAARLLPTSIPSPDDIGLPLAIRKFVDLERGLVLVTGPTGSGKSTTLAALLNQIALKQARHIITLEDPIEFVLAKDGLSQVNQRELGKSFFSFADALRQALRQDPDVILVGELRDPETMRTALTAAETGHLVFGTLHTYDTASSVSRLVASFGAEEQDQVRAQLAYILKGIVSQTLLPHASGKGRVAAFEVMVSSPAVSNNLRKVDGQNSLRQSLETGRELGMQTMEMALADLVRAGQIRHEDAEFRAKDVEDLRRRLIAPDSGASYS